MQASTLANELVNERRREEGGLVLNIDLKKASSLV